MYPGISTNLLEFGPMYTKIDTLDKQPTSLDSDYISPTFRIPGNWVAAFYWWQDGKHASGESSKETKWISMDLIMAHQSLRSWEASQLIMEYKQRFMQEVMLPANGVGETLHGSNGFLVSGCVRKEQD